MTTTDGDADPDSQRGKEGKGREQSLISGRRVVAVAYRVERTGRWHVAFAFAFARGAWGAQAGGWLPQHSTAQLQAGQPETFLFLRTLCVIAGLLVPPLRKSVLGPGPWSVLGEVGEQGSACIVHDPPPARRARTIVAARGNANRWPMAHSPPGRDDVVAHLSQPAFFFATRLGRGLFSPHDTSPNACMQGGSGDRTVTTRQRD
ncbi:hypothetical protein F5148DRAFT_1149184 [Russula earlei]|uniref:Uncharacterized protein n=1 Tax=Russula earlei TaxID=71964 RepID=A0ACC0U9C9_9AGAM|nr:hypothetical protein F5148DRAFT_1149184 [Russula earlei]